MAKKKDVLEVKAEVVTEKEAVAMMRGDDEMPSQTRAIIQYPDASAVDVHPEVVKRKLESIKLFQQLIRSNMIEGQDYGVIPGTPRPTLLKPGAEKIIKLMNLADIITIEDKIENWETGFFYYRSKCELVSLISNQVVATGIGSCNSKEDRFRWRWIAEDYLTPDQRQLMGSVPFKVRRAYGKEFKVYRFENEEIFTQVNTLLKMSKKRALIDAALSVGRLSNLFTQDSEDTGSPDSFFTQSTKRKRAESKPAVEKEEPEVKPDPLPKKNAGPKVIEKGTKDSFAMTTLMLTNGRKLDVTQFQALDYFKAIKESLSGRTGDDAMYYATLEQFGYKHANEVPIEKIAGVWDTLVGVWKMYQNREK